MVRVNIVLDWKGKICQWLSLKAEKETTSDKVYLMKLFEPLRKENGALVSSYTVEGLSLMCTVGLCCTVF